MLNGLGTPAGITAARFIEKRIDAYVGAGSEGAVPVHDVVCTAHLVRPDVVNTQNLHAAVETTGSLTVGRMAFDMRPESAPLRNADVAVTAAPISSPTRSHRKPKRSAAHRS
ncbi:nucleoside hydrolase [Saccharopolyspora sp. NPDC002578]